MFGIADIRERLLSDDRSISTELEPAFPTLHNHATLRQRFLAGKTSEFDIRAAGGDFIWF
jgi:hypothetical protein